MHSPFRHTALPQTTPLLAAQGHDLTDNWSLPSPVPISLTADAHFSARLGAFFIGPDVLKTMYRSTIPLRFI